MSILLTRIFLLSHMRAYTSLLGHLLGSHPDINGYYELHQSYATPGDLTRQEHTYARHDALKPASHYLFDKLLHNDYTLNLQLPELHDAKLLITLRQPAPTLKSILHLFAHKNTPDPYAQPAEATRYYIGRLQQLAEFAGRHPQRYGYFDAELLRTHTDRLLATLADWLQLTHPLSANYQHFSQTGVAGAGDTSPAIKSGKVMTQANAYTEITLDKGLLQQAELAYQRCRERLLANALSTVVSNLSVNNSA